MIKENISLDKKPKNEVIEKNQKNGVISSQWKEIKHNEDYCCEELFPEPNNNNSSETGVLEDYLHYLEKCDEQLLKGLNIVYEEDYEHLLSVFDNNSSEAESLEDYLHYLEKFDEQL